MKRETKDMQHELYKQSCELRKLSSKTKDFKRARELHKEQDKVYKKWLFFKNLENAIDKTKEGTDE